MTDKELITKILEVWETKGMCGTVRGRTAWDSVCEPHDTECTKVCLVGATQLVNGARMTQHADVYETIECEQLQRILGGSPFKWFDAHMDAGMPEHEIKQLLKDKVGL